MMCAKAEHDACEAEAGPGCGTRGRRRGLAGQRADAPSEARSADGSRAGRRPRAHQAARPHAPPATPVVPQAAPARLHPQRHEAATGFPATASPRSRSGAQHGATSDQAVMST